jgi:lipopolysaccharide exporter
VSARQPPPPGTEAAPPGLAGRTAWGVVWALVAASGARLLWLVALACLTRLLSPQEFGLLAFALVFILYVETLGDLGTGVALVRWPADAARAAQVTFWVNLGAGLLWFSLTLALAPGVAAFFGHPEGAPVLRVLGATFLLKALGNTHDALCVKAMRFRARMVPELGQALTKGAVAVALAWQGLGVWSLVAGQLAGLAVWVAGLWVVVPWRPRLALPSELVAPMLRFGGPIVAVNVLAALVHHVDLVIVGGAFGAVALGLYQLATKLSEMTVVLMIWVGGKVLLPAFSLLQSSRQALADAYLAALRYVGALAVPLATGLALMAEPVVVILFGADWRGAAPILQALAVHTGLRALGSHAGDVLKATGRSGLLAALGVAKAVVLVPALLLAAPGGAVAVAWVLAAVTALGLLVDLAVIRRLLGLAPEALLGVLAPSLVAGVVLVLALSGWRLAAADVAASLGLVGGALLGGAAYLAALVWIDPRLFTQLRQSLGTRAAVAEEAA